MEILTLPSHSLKAMLKPFIRNSPKSLPFVRAVTILLSETFLRCSTLPRDLGAFQELPKFPETRV